MSESGEIQEQVPNNLESARALPAKEGIQKAQGFFREQGFSIAPNGTLQPSFTPDQLSKLKARKDSTMEQNSGSLMPTEEEFYQDVLLGVSLWPQVKNGQIQYLIGRGAGVEVALRGEVVGRDRNNVTLPFRGHSDFDFYGVPYETLPDSLANAHPGQSVYTPEFEEVFGGQEYYPLKATKAFHSTLPGALLHETAETVDLGGVKVLVPELEILALDKLLTPEATPRKDDRNIISDAVAIALQYNLDHQKMIDYYERFVIEPEKGSVQQAVEEGAETYLHRFQRQYKNLVKDIMKKEGISHDEALELINNRVSYFVENPEEAKDLLERSAEDRVAVFGSMFGLPDSDPNAASKVTSDMVIAGSITPGFIEAPYWVSLQLTDFDEEGNIVSANYRKQVSSKYAIVREPEIRRERAKKVIDFFAEVERAKAA